MKLVQNALKPKVVIGALEIKLACLRLKHLDVLVVLSIHVPVIHSKTVVRVETLMDVLGAITLILVKKLKEALV